jgi:hypothetical protein
MVTIQSRKGGRLARHCRIVGFATEARNSKGQNGPAEHRDSMTCQMSETTDLNVQETVPDVEHNTRASIQHPSRTKIKTANGNIQTSSLTEASSLSGLIESSSPV